MTWLNSKLVLNIVIGADTTMFVQTPSPERPPGYLYEIIQER